MLYLSSTLSIVMLSTSLFAMNKKDSPEDPKTPLSCHMESKVWAGHVDKETGAIRMTYKYHDGSKSTYTNYKDSSKDEKK